MFVILFTHCVSCKLTRRILRKIRPTWMFSCDTIFPALTHLCCWVKTDDSCCVCSFQEPGMMTPQRARRRRTMPSIQEDTMSTCGTSALKMVPPPATPSVSPTPTRPRWTQSEIWTQDSSELCSSANQVSVKESKGQILCLLYIIYGHLKLVPALLFFMNHKLYIQKHKDIWEHKQRGENFPRFRVFEWQ